MSCFVRAGVAVFLMWYKKDVLQGEVYPLSREERVYRFVYKCRRWRIGWLTPCSAAGSFNTLTLAVPAVASVACNMLIYGFVRGLYLMASGFGGI